MPSGVYTVRLAGLALFDGLLEEQPVVPEQRIWVIRDLQLVNGEGTNVRLIIYLLTGSVLLAFWDGTFVARETKHQELRQVMVPGDQLQFLAIGGNMQVFVTGYDLASTG